MLEIFKVSNKQADFKIIKFNNMFFIRVFLEYGFEQIKKLVEISAQVFESILVYPNEFDVYSIKTIANTDKIKVESFINLSCTIYMLDGLYFLEKWNRPNEILIEKITTTQIDIKEYTNLKLTNIEHDK